MRMGPKQARSFDELLVIAKRISYDPARSLKDQLRAVEALRKHAEQCEDTKGELEDAFVYLYRSATIVNDYLPKHYQYGILTPKQQADLAKVRTASSQSKRPLSSYSTS